MTKRKKITAPLWLKKLGFFIHGRPATRIQLRKVLSSAQQDNLFDTQALSMLEGVLRFSEMRVGDIMIPRNQMIAIEKKQTLKELVPFVIESHHSRFPVYDEDLDDIEGVLLAKDLLPYLLDQEAAFPIQALLRPTIFIPESKRLNTLLREFRTSKNHMAIVIDEYGHVAGLITLENVLEQIVGDIEDEHDIQIEEPIKKHNATHFTVKALTSMYEFNDYFPYQLPDEGCDTIGGLVLKQFGRVPTRKEKITVGPYTFIVMHADARSIRLLKVILAHEAS
jgi:magnesium and cobalt transporter